jgi:hypothetical protein
MNSNLTPYQLDEIAWKHLSTLPYFRGMLRAVEHSLYARLELRAPILDIGAGDGNFADALGTGSHSLGIDPWYEPIRKLKPLGFTGCWCRRKARAACRDASFPAP